MGKFLYRGICYRIGIKDFLPKQTSFCEYTSNVVAYIVISGKGRSGLDIWPETPNQAIGTEDMIFTTGYEEATKRMEIHPQQHYLPGPSAKKACYASYISSYLKNSYIHLVTDS